VRVRLAFGDGVVVSATRDVPSGASAVSLSAARISIYDYLSLYSIAIFTGVLERDVAGRVRPPGRGGRRLPPYGMLLVSSSSKLT